jgi:hypothetical protein
MWMINISIYNLYASVTNKFLHYDKLVLVNILTALPYIEWVNIQMLATEVTENTEVFSFVGAASAANSSRSDGLFAAKAAPTFTVVQVKTTK